MGLKPYKQRITERLAIHAEQDQSGYEDVGEIATWDDAVIAEFFRMMVAGVREDIESKNFKNPVGRVFVEAHLMPEDPFSWFYLVQDFAAVHYNRKPIEPEFGARYKDHLWAQLKDIVDNQEKRDLQAACRRLVTLYPETYFPSKFQKLQTTKAKRYEAAARALRHRIKGFGWRPESFEFPNRPNR